MNTGEVVGLVLLVGAGLFIYWKDKQTQQNTNNPTVTNVPGVFQGTAGSTVANMPADVTVHQSALPNTLSHSMIPLFGFVGVAAGS